MNWCLKCGQERSQIGRCPVCGKLVLVNKNITTETVADEPVLDRAAMTRLLTDINEEDGGSLERLLEEVHSGFDD